MRGEPTFINIGLPFPDPDRFQVVIFGDSRDAFVQPPERWLKGTTVCVTGAVEAFGDVAEIVATEPGQFQLLD